MTVFVCRTRTGVMAMIKGAHAITGKRQPGFGIFMLLFDNSDIVQDFQYRIARMCRQPLNAVV